MGLKMGKLKDGGNTDSNKIMYTWQGVYIIISVLVLIFVLYFPTDRTPKISWIAFEGETLTCY